MTFSHCISHGAVHVKFLRMHIYWGKTDHFWTVLIKGWNVIQGSRIYIMWYNFYFGVVQGPSMEITKLAPSLIELLEAVTINDSQYNGPEYEVYDILQTALQDLTDLKRRSGLSWDLTKILDELLLNMNTNNEEIVNVAIVNHILLRLTRSCFILKKGHSKVLNFRKRAYLPETFSWDGLALGK